MYALKIAKPNSMIVQKYKWPCNNLHTDYLNNSLYNNSTLRNALYFIALFGLPVTIFVR